MAKNRYKTIEMNKVSGTPFFVIPDGKYLGYWSGCNVDMTYKGDNYKIKTEQGVRGINIRVDVIIENGECWIEL